MKQGAIPYFFNSAVCFLSISDVKSQSMGTSFKISSERFPIFLVIMLCMKRGSNKYNFCMAGRQTVNLPHTLSIACTVYTYLCNLSVVGTAKSCGTFGPGLPERCSGYK